MPLFLFLTTALFGSARVKYFNVVPTTLSIFAKAKLAWQSSSKYESSLSYSYCPTGPSKVIRQCFGIFDLPHRDPVLINLFTVPRKQIDLPIELYLCRSYFWSPAIHVPCLNTPFLRDLTLD